MKEKLSNGFVGVYSELVTEVSAAAERLGEEVKKLGTAFLKLGLKGKRIAVIGKNRYEWALSYYAAVCGVGTVVPLDKGLPASEIESSILRAKVYVSVFEESQLDIIKDIVNKKISNLKTLICMDELKDKVVKNLKDLLKSPKRSSSPFLNAPSHLSSIITNFIVVDPTSIPIYKSFAIIFASF